MTVKLVLLYVNLPYLVFQVTRRYRTVIDNLVNVDNPKKNFHTYNNTIHVYHLRL